MSTTVCSSSCYNDRVGVTYTDGGRYVVQLNDRHSAHTEYYYTIEQAKRRIDGFLHHIGPARNMINEMVNPKS